jgi:predicted TIM-barrel enzyme
LKKEALVICHGGPFDEPENVGAALKKMPGIAGFYGASSAERLPTERAIKAQVVAFKALKMS